MVRAWPVVIPWFRRLKASVTNTTTLTSSTAAASARSRPRSLRTRPARRVPGRRFTPAITASASAMVGTRSGWTKLTASTRRTPVANARSMSSILAWVDTTVDSSWRPSREATSTISTAFMDSLFRYGDIAAHITGLGPLGRRHLHNRFGPVVELGPQGPRHHRMLQVESPDIGQLQNLFITQLSPEGIEQTIGHPTSVEHQAIGICLLYTSDAADDLLCVDLGGRR